MSADFARFLGLNGEFDSSLAPTLPDNVAWVCASDTKHGVVSEIEREGGGLALQLVSSCHVANGDSSENLGITRRQETKRPRMSRIQTNTCGEIPFAISRLEPEFTFVTILKTQSEIKKRQISFMIIFKTVISNHV